MQKLIAIAMAALFTASFGAIAADDKKAEAKKDDKKAEAKKDDKKK